ncbi:hypothetical protein BDP27DRAFT_1422903 [Rhodocollybia butyracea]|uniref:Uncharacterized protein n=1 Tax=Rhodocollybia butyracea TaxID=206335 RepID=A0A9P5PKB5_9AGAR|nr:hypothetical protein BDP27DRAFT_1422903 [Rhodocollybia butyracea]
MPHSKASWPPSSIFRPLLQGGPKVPLNMKPRIETVAKPTSLKDPSSVSRTTQSGRASYMPRPPTPTPQPALKTKSKASAKAPAKPKALKVKAKPKGTSKAKAKVVADPSFELKDEPNKDLPVALLACQPWKIPTWSSTKPAKVVRLDIVALGAELMVQDTPDNSDDGEWEDEGAGSGGEEWEDSRQGEGSPQPLVSAASAPGSHRSSVAQMLEGVYPPPLKMTAKHTGGCPLCCRDKMPTCEALIITRNNIPKHALLDSLFRKLMAFSPDKLMASLDSEKYQTLVLDFQALPSIWEIFPFGPSKVYVQTYKHPFKVNPSWGLTPELCRLDKIPLINGGSNSYTASNLIHANWPSDIGNTPKGREMACPSCKSCKPKDSPDCNIACDENGNCCYGFHCNVCEKVHLFCPDNLKLGKYMTYMNDMYNSSVGAPDSLQHIIWAIMGLCSVLDQAAAIVKQQKKLLTLIATSFDQELQQLQEIGKDPLVFLEIVVPTLPDKSIGLNKWAFFVSLMNWDSALTPSENWGIPGQAESSKISKASGEDKPDWMAPFLYI